MKVLQSNSKLGKTEYKIGYLLEIQGLRTVAALLVAIYHIWLQRVSGGVDVFFVVSAFFMTLSLTKLPFVSWSSVSNYYTSTLRRIMPGTAVILFFTLIMCIYFLPETLTSAEIKSAAATFVFIQNWYLAFSGSEYLNQGIASSPFQQFWALSLQVQFYFLFPLILFFCSFSARKLSLNYKSVAISTLGLFLVVSLNYSVYVTDAYPAWAYFDSGARLWEFAFGSLLALLVFKFRFKNKHVARFIGTSALVVLVFFGALVDISTQFPGYLALVPVSCASLIVISSLSRGNIPLLTFKPLVWAGDISFSFYLWHWPLLIFCRHATDTTVVSPLHGIIIIISSGLLAYATTRWIETPFRKTQKLTTKHGFTLVACAALLIPSVAVLGYWANSYLSKKNQYQDILELFIKTDLQTVGKKEGAELVPAPIIARADLPAMYNDNCHQNGVSAELITCEYGDKESEQVIVLVGGSHSAQYLPPLEIFALKNNYKILSMTKSACLFTLTSYPGKAHLSCQEWSRRAFNEILNVRPTFVFSIATRGSKRGPDIVLDAYHHLWDKFEEEGIPFFGVRDNPMFPFDVAECVSSKFKSRDRCKVARKDVYSIPAPMDDVSLPYVYFADLSDVFCDEKECATHDDVILYYRDSHHLTRTFALSITPALSSEIQQALAQWSSLGINVN